jgi:hypothetical protein
VIGVALGALALTRENALVFVAVIGLFAVVATRTISQRAAAGGRRRPGARARCGAERVGSERRVLRHYFAIWSQLLYREPRRRGRHLFVAAIWSRRARVRASGCTELAERAVGRPLGPGEVSSYWTDRAITFITSQPAAWLSLIGRKVLLLMNATEMVDTESQETHAEWSWPLRVLGPITHFGVLLPLAVLGIWATWRRSASIRMLAALTVSYAVSVVMFYVFARYRYPLVPLLVLFASAGVLELRSLAASRRVVPLAMVITAAIVCNWPLIPRDWLKAVSENNIAVALQAEGAPMKRSRIISAPLNYGLTMRRP